MTEHQWLTSADPKPLLEFFLTRASDRLLRLFACSCARQLWDLLPDDNRRRAIEVAERFADGGATREELEAAFNIFFPGESDQDLRRQYPDRAAYDFVSSAQCASLTALPFVGGASGAAERVPPHMVKAAAAAAAARVSVRDARGRAKARARAAQAAERKQAFLLREIFGNPFRRVVFAPSWRSANAVAVAQQIYEGPDPASGAFDPYQLGVLADTLTDAGCTNALVLDHLRGGGDHVRGCWAVDLVLEKN